MKPYSLRRRLALAVGILVVAGWVFLGSRLEREVNRVSPVSLPRVNERAAALHSESFVADLHADSMLFGRDLRKRSEVGHVDLPRLQEGGVALQVFSLPTVVPLGTNIHRTEKGPIDLLTLAGIAQFSKTALLGPAGRAHDRAAGLRRTIADSDGQMRLIRTRADLADLVRSRRAGEKQIGALLALEGAHAMESDPEKLQSLFDAGYRMVGLAHFFDNDYAGSASGVKQGGLTPLGRETIREMERLGMTLDLAHLSPAAVDEALDLATRPTVFSHGGVRGTCDNPRNLSDDQIRRIAAGGGVIGIGYWPIAVCGRTPKAIARSLAYVVRLVGADHAALGSDYDGATTVGFDTRHLATITQALVNEGLRERVIRKILGLNVARVLAANLPASSAHGDGSPRAKEGANSDSPHP